MAAINVHKYSYGFSRFSGELRTDFSFKERIHREHHILLEETELEKIGVNMVTQFPLDPMHLVDLGVTKKLLQFILSNGCNDFRMTQENRVSMSQVMCSLSSYLPTDFVRLPRNFDEVRRFKASEFRLIMLYTGIVFLKDYVQEIIYEHWLCLHCAYRILSHPTQCKEDLNIAAQLLEKVVQDLPKIYEPRKLSYNIHNLLHLSACVERFGHIGNFSAYRFENYMQEIKKIIKSGNKILQQLKNRVAEMAHFNQLAQKKGFI